ncbi:MAG: nucleotide exchange factor GrpE [Patescibacteria group bacterium]
MEEVKKYPEAVTGALIYNDQNQVLLIKNPKWGEYWSVPGGHIELGETMEESLRREIMEETGLEIDKVELLMATDGVYPREFARKKHFVFLNFFAHLAGGQITLSDEMTEYIWVEPAIALKEMNCSSTITVMLEAFAGRLENKESWENKYLRALADYQNLLKQTAKDKEDFAKYALTDFLHNVLPVYDHLKLAMAGLGEADNQNPWAEGVRHVLKQFKDVLSQHGIEEIETVGQKFDHNTMDALDGSGDTVKQEVMPGYRLNGKVIRPAKVVVE